MNRIGSFVAILAAAATTRSACSAGPAAAAPASLSSVSSGATPSCWATTTAPRGGSAGEGIATSKPATKKRPSRKPVRNEEFALSAAEAEPYSLLARALRSQLAPPVDPETGAVAAGDLPDVERIVAAFKSLASAQKAFKGLDGAAHEAYQVTHSTSSSSAADLDAGLDGSVAGRATRSAARAGAVADGLGGCELCELIEYPGRFDDDMAGDNQEIGSLAGRQVLLNQTNAVSLGERIGLDVLLLHEPDYRGGAGLEHGGIAPVEPSTRAAVGRLVVVLRDSASQDLAQTVALLSEAPIHVRLGEGGAALSEAASVPPGLYRAAGSLLRLLEEPLRAHNASAVHFVGRSLAGGVASLAAAILHGSLVLPADKKKLKKVKRTGPVPSTSAVLLNETAAATNATAVVPLQGFGAGRTSALTLGAPPCMSPNVPADFVTSLVYGDDLVCRASHDALRRLLNRTRRGLKAGGGGWVSVGRQVGWVTDALSLAASNLRSHARGSEGEEARLSVPGRAYLVHPRRRGGGACSIHEIGGQLKGGREALRAAVLWQLNDVLLSKSMWKHHQLESYIQGLDRVHLRGLDEH